MRKIATAIFFCLTVASLAQGHDAPVRWAVDGQIGAGILTVGRNKAADNSFVVSNARQRDGMVTRLRGELYLPDAHFSLKGGYEHERLGMLSGDAETSFSELSIGGRYYPAPFHWAVQPFAGVDGFLNVGSIGENYSMKASSGYCREMHIRQPRFSISPMAGADIYLFSHIALQVEYGYRLGIDSRMKAVSAYGANGRETFTTRSNLHRHTFSVGLKLTFPFRFTSKDGNRLIEGLIESL